MVKAQAGREESESGFTSRVHSPALDRKAGTTTIMTTASGHNFPNFRIRKSNEKGSGLFI
jgi:hypothetical protein